MVPVLRLQPSLCILNQNFEPGLFETGELVKDAQIIPNSGFSVARWIVWRDRIEEFSRCGNGEVEQFALEALRTMKFWGDFLRKNWVYGCRTCGGMIRRNSDMGKKTAYWYWIVIYSAEKSVLATIYRCGLN